MEGMKGVEKEKRERWRECWEVGHIERGREGWRKLGKKEDREKQTEGERGRRRE